LKHKFWSKLVSGRDVLIPWGLGWLLALISTWIFVDLAGDVWLKEGFTWDAPVMLAIHRYARPWLTQLMLVITSTGQSVAVIVLAIVLYWLWRRERKLDALTALVPSALCLNWYLHALARMFSRPSCRQTRTASPAVIPWPLSLSTACWPSCCGAGAIAGGLS
jgi:hypothetical protein